LTQQKSIFKFVLNNLEKNQRGAKIQNPEKKNHQGAKMEYKTKKKFIFALGNIKYNESSCQPCHTSSNDGTTFFSNVVAGRGI